VYLRLAVVVIFTVTVAAPVTSNETVPSDAVVYVLKVAPLPRRPAPAVSEAETPALTQRFR